MSQLFSDLGTDTEAEMLLSFREKRQRDLERRICSMAAEDGLSVKEIADITMLTEAAVKKILSDAR